MIFISCQNFTLIFLHSFLDFQFQRINIVVKFMMVMLNLRKIIINILLGNKQLVSSISTGTHRRHQLRIIRRFNFHQINFYCITRPWSLQKHLLILYYINNLSESISLLLWTHLLLLLLLILLFLYKKILTDMKSAAFFLNYYTVNILSYS